MGLNAAQAIVLLATMALLFVAIASRGESEPDQPSSFVELQAPLTATPTIGPPGPHTNEIPPRSAPTATPVPPTPTPTIPAPVAPVQAAEAWSPPPGNVITDYLDTMHAAEAEYGLPGGVIAAQYLHESSGNPYNCPAFNCTGIGQGSRGGMYRFSSYEEGIYFHAQLLASYPDADLMGKLCRWQNGGKTNPCAYGYRVIASMENYQ